MSEIEKLVKRLRAYPARSATGGKDPLSVGNVCALLEEAATAIAALKGAEEERDAAVAALARAPILSKFHGERGFELENFVEAYAGWKVEARAALASNSGGG